MLALSLVPTYEYRCNACGKRFEYMQRMSEDAKTDCEACGESALERLISATAFHLKGSGWYKDLYSSAKPGSDSSSDSSSSDSSSPSSESSSNSSSSSSESSSDSSSSSSTDKSSSSSTD